MRICHTKYENTTNKFVSRLEGEPLQDHPKKKATYKDKTTSKEIEPTEEIQKSAVFAFSKYILNKL